MNTPTRAQYASGSVDFLDSDANPIPGVATQPLDANGGVNLSALPLTSSLPQFLLTLEGLTGSLGEVVLTLTWDATYDPACLSPTVNALPPAAPATTSPATTQPPAAPTTSPAAAQPPAAPTATSRPVAILPETGSSNAPFAGGALALIVLGAGLVLMSVRFRTDR